MKKSIDKSKFIKYNFKCVTDERCSKLNAFEFGEVLKWLKRRPC